MTATWLEHANFRYLEQSGGERATIAPRGQNNMSKNNCKYYNCQALIRYFDPTTNYEFYFMQFLKNVLQHINPTKGIH